ncbi:unnamed protein product [Orchesella dallaii]|uniref:Uncharacterized protein n=1 Tax=Orchesella dallaii TaxID=48710 RepID=A0ABP1PXJ5_9HEXA
MDSTMNSTIALPQPSKNCGDPNCPRHGKSQVVAPNVRSNNAPSHCGDKNCRKHGEIATGKPNNEQPKSQWKTVEIEVNRPTHLTAPATNVMTFFTTNNNNVGEPTGTPATSPAKFDSSSNTSYSMMKLEHAKQEINVITAMNINLNHEVLDLKKQLEDERRYRVQERKLRHSMRAELEARVRMCEELKVKLTEAENMVGQLKKKLQQVEMTAQKLRRRASENAQTASKWRSKVLAVQEAQKTLEWKQREAEKLSTYFAKKVREQHSEMHQLQRQLGQSLAESDISEAQSATLDTMNTSMFDIDVEPLTPMRQTTPQES